VISTAEYLHFVDKAFAAMTGIVADLGDELANARPDLPGANSPYVILHHCLGVTEFWGGHVVSGRENRRDRPAEFRASGPVAELLARAERARRQLHADAEAAEPDAPPRNLPEHRDADTQGGILLHVYEELAQHLGQLELTRDVLRGARS
jgi:hypothetical protein